MRMLPSLKLLITFLLFLPTSFTFAQSKRNATFSVKDGMCSDMYKLDSLGHFFHDSGCEGRYTQSIGSYQINQDKITFTAENQRHAAPVLKISECASLDDSTCKVIFKSRDGKVISDEHFIVDAIDTSGKFFKRCAFSNAGETLVNFKKYRSLRINNLQFVYNKWIYVDLKNRDMEIFLNFPEELFHYANPIIKTENPVTFTLKEDGLYSLDGKDKMFSLEN